MTEPHYGMTKFSGSPPPRRQLIPIYLQIGHMVNGQAEFPGQSLVSPAR
jgi:hypothetical protein